MCAIYLYFWWTYGKTVNIRSGFLNILNTYDYVYIIMHFSLRRHCSKIPQHCLIHIHSCKQYTVWVRADGFRFFLYILCDRLDYCLCISQENVECQRRRLTLLRISVGFFNPISDIHLKTHKSLRKNFIEKTIPKIMLRIWLVLSCLLVS